MAKPKRVLRFDVDYRCGICGDHITCKDIRNRNVHSHHFTYRSEGGTDEHTGDVHKSCHIRLHSTPREERGGLSDFQFWGKQGGKLAAERRPEVWRQNLKNVNRHPDYAAA